MDSCALRSERDKLVLQLGILATLGVLGVVLGANRFKNQQAH
ncbi:hypothetical protein ACWGHI_23325 [Streptomyces sp. NPDC054912]